MGFEAILTLIISIISMIMQLISGGKPPTPNPIPDPVFPEFAQVSCQQPGWEDESSSGYVQGRMTEYCSVHFRAIPLSGSSVVDRMTRTMEDQIAADGVQVDQVFDMSSGSSVERTYDSAMRLDADGATVEVAGQTKLSSDYQKTVSSTFSASSLPKSGNGSYLKALRTRTDVKEGEDGETFYFRFVSQSTTQRPWWAPSGKFKAMLIDGLRSKTDEAAKRALLELINNL